MENMVFSMTFNVFFSFSVFYVQDVTVKIGYFLRNEVGNENGNGTHSWRRFTV